MNTTTQLPSESYASGAQDRQEMLEMLLKISSPVLGALAAGKLRATLPCEPWETQNLAWSFTEAFARTLSGITPWLELGADSSPEGQLRGQQIALAAQATRMAFDPASPDWMDWSAGKQDLVEAAYISQSLLQAPVQLWSALDGPTKERIIAMLEGSRAIPPLESNWLLFSAMVEAALWKLTGKCQRAPMERAVSKHMEWYAGDGAYGDGPEFHWDYYNSYVIQPMLLTVLEVCRDMGDSLGDLLSTALARASRFTVVLERLISPEATFPIIGRSAVYRLGAFQLIGKMFLKKQAPPSLLPGNTRAALVAVMRRMLGAEGTFDGNGWLRFGVVGFQPKIREGYNATGSLYLTTLGMLPLGLPADDPFWTQPGGPWTQRRIWSSDIDCGPDGAYKEP